jgi:hypothetical protein
MATKGRRNLGEGSPIATIPKPHRRAPGPSQGSNDLEPGVPPGAREDGEASQDYLRRDFSIPAPIGEEANHCTYMAAPFSVTSPACEVLK